jgi:antitoxin (DNA-binding transcriptional repressor) of toxin-antitoxin stability system
MRPGMKTVNIHEAKTNLSRLIAGAVAGEPFVIARAGKPLVRVEAIAGDDTRSRPLDMLKGRIEVPDDFDRMGEDEIADMFGG